MPITTVSSIAPRFVKPFATVSVAWLVLPSTCPTRSTEPAFVVSAPLIAEFPDAMSVPWLPSATFTLEATRVRAPAFASTPPPAKELFVATTTPFAPTVSGPASVSVRLLIVNVCDPLAPPRTRPATFVFTSSATVYVPPSVMFATSAAVGRRFRFQFAAMLQLPPLGLIHEMTVAPIVNGSLVAAVIPPPVATNV